MKDKHVLSACCLLHSREIGRKVSRKRFFPILKKSMLNMIGSMKSMTWNEEICKKFDKIFAICWVRNNSVIAGTKDNKLLHFNVDTGCWSFLPLCRGSERRMLTPNCGIHAAAINDSHELLATGGDNPSDLGVYLCSHNSEAGEKRTVIEPLCVLEGHSDWVFGCAWLNGVTIAR
jgi:hypothetical protein